MDLKLEVVVIPVSDVDRAKQFYGTALGCREDIDAGGGDFRVVQMTPPGSACSIAFGQGITSAAPGSVDRLLLAVDDIEKARNELVDRGVDVGEIFHDAGGSLGAGFIAAPEAHAPGPDPQRRSYASYASFRDPDGNAWMLQELTERLPGRV